MSKYVKSINTYAYFKEILSLLLRAGAVAFLCIVLVNLVPADLSTYRIWLESNFAIVLSIVILVLLATWQRLIPTLRTLLKIKRGASSPTQRLKDDNRLLLLFVVGLALLFCASLPDISFFDSLMRHPTRYGYIGDFFLGIALLGLVAKLGIPSKAEVSQGFFVNDDPRDILEFTASQQQAVAYLTSILDSGMPRSVALTGDWGSGKTAVYRKTRLNIAKKHTDIVWVDFDPWRYASEEALVKGFYESIARQIDGDVPGYQNALRSIASGVDHLVSKSDSSGIFQAMSNTIKDFTADGANPDIIIKELLDREGKRLIVVMDDIERQYDTERTYRALQLVHHIKTMGKDNVQMLCIYEKSTLLRAAPLHVPSGEEYLEKFSEIEISVPPPDESSLRNQLEKLINNPQYSAQLPDDFELKLSSASVKDIKSHRGIIRAFNELLLEFNSTKNRYYKLDSEDDSEADAITYVNYSDRFLMGHLKLKYPTIFRDIAKHRQEYTQVKENEESLRTMFMDKDELRSEREARLETLFDGSNIDKEQRNTIKDLLVDLFPALKDVINQSNSHVDLTELRRERRVGHRDVLDAYFALTSSQDAYLRHEDWINELISEISSASDNELMSRFSTYMTRALDDSSATDSITLLRNELMKPKHKNYQLRAFRAWMRVILGSKRIEVDEDNRGLARILSAINEIALKSQPEERLDIGKNVFLQVTKYIANPASALLMLLFVLPEQGNGYLSDYINSKAFKRGGLYQRVLKWVDNYYAENQINIYEQYEYKDWAFIAYQWALSSRSGGSGVNPNVIGAASRHERVNDYLFSKLNLDDRVAYRFIHSRFWHEKADEGYDDGYSGWRVNDETATPYDLTRLLSLATKLVKSTNLTVAQRRLIKSFIDDLGVFMKIFTPSS